jgi:hypothetical protein
MQVLVYDGQVVGLRGEMEGLPGGFEAYEAPDIELSRLFFDGKEVREVPSSPGEDYYWYQDKWLQVDKPPTGATVPPLAENPLALSVYNYIAKKYDETLADTVALLLSLQQGDGVEAEKRKALLAKRFTNGD